MPVARVRRARVPDEREVRARVEAAYAAVPAIHPDTALGRGRHLIYLRNIAIVEVLQVTGILLSELVALRRCDLDEARQCAYAPDGRRLVFDLEGWGALARYLGARGDLAGYPLLIRHRPVFARHGGSRARRGLSPLDARSVHLILAKLQGSGSAVRPRDLRVRFAHWLLEATKDKLAQKH
jgi:integrase